MAKKELIQHLRQKISEGYSVEQIEATLKKNGYSEKEIKQILEKAVANEKYKPIKKIRFSFEKILMPLITAMAILILIAFLYSISNIEKAVKESGYEEFNIIGDSMLPTLKNGDKVFLDEEYYKKNPVKKGDIIALKLKTQEKPFVKRVIAVSGDKLEFREGNIYVNGEKLEEPYILDKGYHYNPEKIRVVEIPLKANSNTIPKNSIFVLGDNRKESDDSFAFGFLPEEYVVGKIVK